MMLTFTVLGQPATAGSKRAIPYRKSVENGGGLGVRVTHDNKRYQSWSQECRNAAHREIIGPDWSLMESAIVLVVAVYLPRPKGHFGSGRNAATVRTSAPPWHMQKPDMTKLVRACEDALTGVVWRDDCQIVRQITSKDWGEPARVEIGVGRWPNDYREILEAMHNWDTPAQSHRRTTGEGEMTAIVADALPAV